MRMRLLALFAAVTLGFAATAQAATVLRTYEIAFVQYGLGDDAADWFGKLTVLCDGSVRICDGSVRTFRAVVQGVTYDTQADLFPGPIRLVDDPSVASPYVDGFAFSGVPIPGTLAMALQMNATTFGRKLWFPASCDVGDGCFGGLERGTYTVAPVPLPAALPLVLTAVAALAGVSLLRRHRN